MIAAMPGSAVWAAGSADYKARSLVTATRLLDRQCWQGEKTSPSQALQWPRTGVVDKYGDEVSSLAVPLLIEEATYELALAILVDPDGVQADPTSNQNLKKVKAGSAEVEFFRPELRGRFVTIVEELVGQFLCGSVNAASLSQAWGTDSESEFDSADDVAGLDGAL